MNKLNLLKLTLFLGAVYYAIGGIAHYFGLTIFPFFVSELHVPYQDSVIALACLVFVLILLTLARDPVKNIDVLRVVILSAFIASLFSFTILAKVDFASYGAPDKKLQTIVEGVLGLFFTASLLIMHPNKRKN